MVVVGIVQTEPRARRDAAGRPYFEFKIREDLERDGYTQSSTFEVHGYVELMHADLAEPGRWSQVSGELKVLAFLSADGVPYALRRILASSVTPHELRREPPLEAPELPDLPRDN